MRAAGTSSSSSRRRSWTGARSQTSRRWYVTEPAEAVASADQLQWADIDKQGREHVKERKIRVSFLPAHDTSTPQKEGVNGVVRMIPPW